MDVSPKGDTDTGTTLKSDHRVPIAPLNRVGKMHILRLEHPIRDFETWKAAFDRVPVGRQ